MMSLFSVESPHPSRRRTHAWSNPSSVMFLKLQHEAGMRDEEARFAVEQSRQEPVTQRRRVMDCNKRVSPSLAQDMLPV